ncbi:hypothetical protein ILUMI_07784 [Ignelater luminosus]|uniref:Uncharacterized protein n=1 Tax=Ignelater luminosus TaxID=2038154 RepID=A0A8K0GGI2_IGNLU|nr:hypothetical protein ILUMI_07784 [Ignelater luminosus]
MYIRWKTLFGAAIVFWISLCLYDLYFINPVTKSFYSEDDQFDWLSKVSEKEILQETTVREDDIKLTDDSVFAYSMVLWNVVTFFVTIFLCFVGKYSLKYVIQFQEKHRLYETQQTINRKLNSTSKIPVLLLPKTANDDGNTNKDRDSLMNSCASLLTNSSTSLDLAIRPSKSEMSSRIEQQMERQCAKLRDEMITLQANSLKEHAALSRKLESVSREKRDLYRQLTIAQKENRAAKQQLEELLAEKSLLVKRLECASREFKLNTKSKRTALAKLEEAQATIARLKQEMEKVMCEKEIIENKFKILDAEHKSLKERLEKFEPPSQDTFISNKVTEPKRETGDAPKETKTDFYEISQSQKDVQRVQMRLMNLEKQLDRLKFTNSGKKEENTSFDIKEEHKKSPRTRPQSGKSNNKEPTLTDFENDMITLSNLFTSKAETPLEEQNNKDVENLLAQSDNLTDEQRRKILDPIDSSGDDSAASKNFDSLLDFQGEDPFERVGNLLNCIRRSPSPRKDRFNVSCDEIPNETSTSFNEEEDTDDWEPPKGRMVSNSPAFQKFLKNMEPEPHRKKYSPSMHAVF